MIKKLLFFVLAGILFIGCKSKRSVTNSPLAKPGSELSSKKYEAKSELGEGLYELPEDSGKFIRFEISSVNEYIDTFAEIAQMEMKAYGIPASITLAQGLLESGLGKGELALKTNNHFGIKCHTGWDGDYDYHDDDEAGECFRKYNHPMYSFRDHSLFLSSRSRYASLFDLPSDDYKSWARGLQKAGYATDKRYPQKLIQLIEAHHLYQYDRAIVRQGYGQKEPIKVAANVVVPTMHVVKQGDTLYSISRKYAVSVDDLKRWNYIYDNHLSVGQEITVKVQNFNK